MVWLETFGPTWLEKVGSGWVENMFSSRPGTPPTHFLAWLQRLYLYENAFPQSWQTCRLMLLWRSTCVIYRSFCRNCFPQCRQTYLPPTWWTVTMWFARQNFLLNDASQSSQTYGRLSEFSPKSFGVPNVSKERPTHACGRNSYPGILPGVWLAGFVSSPSPSSACWHWDADDLDETVANLSEW